MNREFVQFIVSLLLFGANGIVASQIAMNSYEIVFLRTMIGSLLLLALFLLTRRKPQFWKNKKEFGFLTLSGIAMGFGWIFLFEAYQQIGVGVATILYYCAPMLVMILSPLFFKETLTRKKCLCFCVVLIGLVLVNGQAIQAGKNLWGIFCGGFSALMYTTMVIANKKAEHIRGLENAMLQLLIGFLTVALFLFWKQGITLDIPEGSLLPALLLGFVNTGLSCYLYFSSIGYLRVQTVAICSYLEPLTAVVLSAVFLKEALTPLQVLGGILILGSAYWSEREA